MLKLVEKPVLFVVYWAIIAYAFWHISSQPELNRMQLTKQEYYDASGFYNSVLSEFSNLKHCLILWPYMACFLIICFAANSFEIPQKLLFIELVSILLLVLAYGWQFTITVLSISFAMSVLGTCLQKFPIGVLISGMLLLGYIKNTLEFFTSQEFVNKALYNEMCYSGFYASVVRSMIIGIEYSKLKKIKFAIRLRDTIGYTVMCSVFMSASFVRFTSWANWREMKTKLIMKGPFTIEEVPLPHGTGETFRRVISLPNVIKRFLRIIVWSLILHYLFGSVDYYRQSFAPILRISRGINNLFDSFIVFFISYVLMAKFYMYYVIFYGACRLFGDCQHILLSPVCSLTTSNNWQVSTNREELLYVNERKQVSFWQKLWKTSITLNCLMPEGPSCLMIAKNSSDIWRTFDQGLYLIMKYYIYIPWIKYWQSTSITKTNNLNLSTEKTENSQRKISEPLAISAALLTFIFVLTFHSWSKGNVTWVCGSFVLWTIERFVKNIYHRKNLDHKLIKFLSDSWEVRIRAMAQSLLELINLVSFMFFITNYNSGQFLFKTIFTNFRCFLISWFMIFIPIYLSSTPTPATKEK